MIVVGEAQFVRPVPSNEQGGACAVPRVDQARHQFLQRRWGRGRRRCRVEGGTLELVVLQGGRDNVAAHGCHCGRRARKGRGRAGRRSGRKWVKRAPQRGAVWLGVAAHGTERPVTLNQSGGATPKPRSGPPKVAAALLTHPSRPPSSCLWCASGAPHLHPPPHHPSCGVLEWPASTPPPPRTRRFSK